MKKNLAILAVIFSVVLNIVFIGSYFYHKSKLLPRAEREFNCKRPLYKELSLSPGQLNRLGQRRNSFHSFVDEQGRKIKAKQLELVGLLAVGKPDHRAIDAKHVEIQALQQQMQNRVIDHLLEESRIFTIGQRQKFFALIRGRIEKSDGPRPRWMPRKPGSPSQEKCP